MSKKAVSELLNLRNNMTPKKFSKKLKSYIGTNELTPLEYNNYFANVEDYKLTREDFILVFNYKHVKNNLLYYYNNLKINRFPLEIIKNLEDDVNLKGDLNKIMEDLFTKDWLSNYDMVILIQSPIFPNELFQEYEGEIIDAISDSRNSNIKINKNIYLSNMFMQKVGRKISFTSLGRNKYITFEDVVNYPTIRISLCELIINKKITTLEQLGHMIEQEKINSYVSEFSRYVYIKDSPLSVENLPLDFKLKYAYFFEKDINNLNIPIEDYLDSIKDIRINYESKPFKNYFKESIVIK